MTVEEANHTIQIIQNYKKLLGTRKGAVTKLLKLCKRKGNDKAFLEGFRGMIEPAYLEYRNSARKFLALPTLTQKERDKIDQDFKNQDKFMSEVADFHPQSLSELGTRPKDFVPKNSRERQIHQPEDHQANLSLRIHSLSKIPYLQAGEPQMYSLLKQFGI